MSDGENKRGKTLWLKLLSDISFHPPRREQFELAAEKDSADDISVLEKTKTLGEGGERETGVGHRQRRRPIKINGRHPKKERKDETPEVKERLFPDVNNNLDVLRGEFRIPLNKDVVFREFSIGVDPPVKAAMVFIDGLTEKSLQNDSILEPLMLLSSMRKGDNRESLSLEHVRNSLLPGNDVEILDTFSAAVEGIVSGRTVIFVEGNQKALAVETRGWEHRSVERPSSEMVVRGPQEAFTETLRTNLALVRKSLHAPNLVTEFFKVGKLNRRYCAIMYLDGLTNTSLIKEVKRRIEGIETDFLGGSGPLEQFIEDSPLCLAPQTVSTERPDRVVAGLVEGKIAILVDGSPFALMVPAVFFSIFHTAEDAYIRWPFGTMLRLIRLLGFVLAIFLPGFYVAVTAFHHEMIPTDLLLAISASRENVPFPTIIEVLIMEISFELIREAGIRIPGVIGPTLGIVGALILGQAAVAANIVSPILIIVVALTAIGSFAVPNYSFSFTVRLARFFYILLGAILGIWGLVLGFFINLHLFASLKSFGVPFLAPMAPTTEASPDVIYRGPVWEQEVRPDFLQTKYSLRQPSVSRRWAKKIRKRSKGGKNGD